MIRIENKKTYDGDGFFCARPSPLGNPFRIDGKTSREQAIAQYREWLLDKLETVNPTSKAFQILIDHYKEHGELTLICWCSPLQCHLEVIKEFIQEVVPDVV